MPIISKVGSRSFTVRLSYTIIFCVLILGTITMIYPFALMLSGSVKSEADILSLKPYPEYLFDDLVLYQKYVESKYGSRLELIREYLHKPIASWKRIQRPSEVEFKYLDDFLAWRSKCKWWFLGHGRSLMLPINCRLFREYMVNRFDGDLKKFNEEMSLSLRSWNELFPIGRNFFRSPLRPDKIALAFLEFAETRPIRDRMIENPDGWYCERYLSKIYTTNIGIYNEAHHTTYNSYEQIYLRRHVPDSGLERKDWEDTVRNRLPWEYIRLSPNIADNYRRFLSEKLYENLEAYNRTHKTSFKSFDDIAMPLTLPLSEKKIDQEDWEKFLKNPLYCPVEAIEIYGPRQAFEEFVAEKHGLPLEQVVPLRLPSAAADWHDCMANRSELRWEFTTRNYKQVLGYLLFHGQGIINTIIYCSLAILSALIVNPTAAYALSRYKPPSTYMVLLFCMATMAFPSEVTMIPAFLLLKRFPLWPLIGGAVAFGLSVWILSKLLGKSSEVLWLGISLAIGVAVGLWAVPAITGKPHISLLNTFAALVLPGMANGYMIFLLKGFFDSLPRELYEAADLDGAGEWTKFWNFAMGLSKPLLAVIALGAFTGAYTQFMMALMIIPDPKMWTIMVWLFQLQSQSHQSVVYASLVIAAIPALLIFVLCQGVIMRGIVVPTEK
ncbi:MAG: carbohydrate ABC transporter permease [Phycisphaerae bacterium]